MAADDLSKMNLEALKKHIAELDKQKLDAQALLKSKREEELTMLAAAYAQKLQAGGFTMAEGLTALEPHETGKRTRALRGSLPPKEPKPYKDGLVSSAILVAKAYRGSQRGGIGQEVRGSFRCVDFRGSVVSAIFRKWRRGLRGIKLLPG